MSAPVVPLFPLPEYFLFPGAASPLRIFEPRYLEMVEDLLDSPGRLVLACIDGSAEPGANGGPAVQAIGGLGEIVRHQRLPNGEYALWVVGLARARVDEVDSDRLYRKTRVHLIEDQEPPPDRRATLRPALLAAIDRNVEEELELEEGSSVGFLADILAQCLPLGPRQLERCFRELDPVARAEMVLAVDRRSN